LEEILTISPENQRGLEDAALRGRVSSPSKDAIGLLMLAYYYPPENASGALRPFRFVKYLRKQGYRPEVVSRGTAASQESCKQVHRTSSPEYGSRFTAAAAGMIRVLERTILPYNDQLPWIPYAIATARRVNREHPVLAVMSTSPPVGSHLAAAWIKHEFKIPWIADFRDPLLGNPSRTRRWAAGYDAFLEGLVMRHADVIITNTDNSMETVRSRYPRMAHKIHLIWNGFDPEESIEARPIPSRRYRLLLHAGTLYGGRHPGMLLESLKRLISSGSVDTQTLRLRFIGDSEGSTQDWYKSADLPSLISSGWVDYSDRAVPLEEARREMAEADFLLLLDLNQLGIGAQVPGKVFEYIRIGRPILVFTARDSSTSRLLAKSGIPYVCVYQSDPPAEVDRKVSAFLSLPTRPVAPSEWFQTNFNAITQTQVLIDLLASVARK
jgi:Glycosyl transferase 4-like domain